MPRPRAVTVLCIILAGAAVYAALGAAAAWRQWAWLGALALAVPPAYLVARAVAWSILCAGLALGLWRGWPWARPATFLALLAGLAQDWAERLWLAPAAAARLTWGWALAVDALSVVFVLYALRPAAPGGLSAGRHP